MTTERPQEVSDGSGRDQVGELISRAGARPAPPESVHRAVFAAVADEWSAAVADRRKRRTRRLAIAAAIGIVTVGVALLATTYWPHVSPRAAGTFLASLGRVEIKGGQSTTPIVAGDDILVGTRVTTEPSARALFSVSGVSVRVSGSSDLTFERADVLRVASGRLYVDSGMHAAHSQSIEIETPFGTVRHLGTQFEVSVEPSRVTVRVRDGSVSVAGKTLTTTLDASDQLVIASSGAALRSIVEPYSDVWAWTNDLGPAFPIEGRSFEEFLHWFAHETGRQLRYASDATRLAAQGTRLSGNISGLKPIEALRAVEATTRFACDLSDPSTISIKQRSPIAANPTAQ